MIKDFICEEFAKKLKLEIIKKNKAIDIELANGTQYKSKKAF